MSDITFATDNELWIGTESGAYIYNLRTGKYTHLRSSEYDPYSLSDNAIYSFCKDREDGIWIGSYFGGVNYYPRSYTHLRNIIRKERKIVCMVSGYVNFVVITMVCYGLVRKMAG